ncbi:hypothetical protein BH23GEM6_BH23GEM6_06640 [soil metagenome]
MNDVLRERLSRHLDALPDDQLYQVLDYIEFLSSKYARDRVRPPSSSLQRFGERLEDKLRGQRLGISAIRGTMSAVGNADRFMSGIADAGRSFLRDVTAPAAEKGPEQARLPAPSTTDPIRPEDLPSDE